jgi:hypothetical protein
MALSRYEEEEEEEEEEEGVGVWRGVERRFVCNQKRTRASR